MANNRKQTRGRRYAFRPAAVAQETAFGTIHTDHPTRKIKWDIKYGPERVKDPRTGRWNRTTHTNTHHRFTNS